MPKEAIDERRRLYRTQAPVRIACRPITMEQAELDPYDSAFDLPESLILAESCRNIELDQRPLWRYLHALHTEIGRYLSLQDKKQELLLAALIDRALRMAVTHPSIDLSEGGVSFHYPQALQPDTRLHLILLQERQLHVAATARILHCRDIGGHYILGTEFVCLRDHDRQAIVRLTLRKPA